MAEVLHKSVPQEDFMEDKETLFPEPEGTSEVKGEDVAIEIVDDTPPEDQGKPAVAIEEPLSEEISDEELAGYSQNVQKRIKQLTYEFHTERRTRETAERQNSEAIRYAQAVSDENKQLRQTLDMANNTVLEAIEGRSNAELETARKEFREASEQADTDKMLAAQEKLTSVIAEMKTRPSPRPQTSEDEGQVPTISPTQPAPQPYVDPLQNPPITPREHTWLDANRDWFHNDPEMTSFAYGVHQKLIQESGLHPRRDADRYYESVDQRMREVFPDFFSSREKGQALVPTQTKVDTPGKEPPATVVAPVTRTGSSPRKVRLSQTQVSLAKRLGLTTEQYAQQVLKERMAADG